MSALKIRLKKIFDNANFDVLFIMNSSRRDSNFTYLTDFTSGVFEQSILIAKRDGAVLLTSELEYETAMLQRQDGLRIMAVHSAREIEKVIKDMIQGKIVGIDYGFLSYRAYRIVKKYGKPKKIVDASDALRLAREVKDKAELVKMKKAAQIVKLAFKNIQRHFRVGITEKKIAALFDSIMMENGADGTSFATIVCFGNNAAEPHHSPDNTRLRKNNFILIDAGALYKNYCSDMTRTFIFMPDKRSAKYKKMLDMYNTVKEAQERAFAVAEAGAEGSEVDAAARSYIDSASGGIYKGKFITALGHSIGIDVHDTGPVLAGRKYILKENMVVSNEPGIYIPGFGGVRIEDDMLIMKKKAKFL
jgi:Xaa-Pro dipeptidase